MLELCPKCHKYTVEHDEIASIKRCLNTKCLWMEYGARRRISVEGRAMPFSARGQETEPKLRQNQASA